MHVFAPARRSHSHSRHPRRRGLFAACATVALGLCAPLAQAQAQGSGYPNKPITLVVPFPAGGPTDASARLFAKSIGNTLGQPIVVDNRGGAAGTVGSGFVARSQPDGYTLLWGGTSTLAVAPGLYKNLKYDARSFVPVGMALRGPLMLAGKPGLEAGDLKALLAMARKGELTVGTAGNGSIGHLATAYLSEVAGVKFTHVPYRGGGPAITDALGGQIDLVFDTAAALYPFVKSGKLHAYAVTGSAPYAPAPDVPTVKAALGKNYEAYSWFGLVAPAGTPPAAVQKLVAAMAAASQAREVRDELANTGVEPGVPTAREFSQVVQSDYTKWSGTIARNNVKADD
ncbi:MAG: tripartite tricarboxylate transporter substrate binding protein [Pseudomonadota bacterium]